VSAGQTSGPIAPASGTLTTRERFRRVLDFEPVDRLPVMEWASWWNLTVERWQREGLPADLADAPAIRDYLGLDGHRQYRIAPDTSGCPKPAYHGAGVLADAAGYEAVRTSLYSRRPAFDEAAVESAAQPHARGEIAVWLSLDGFFWYPRKLFGIERHLYAFYDQPELMKRMNEDLLEFNLRVLDRFCRFCTPEFMTFAEDLSYNHGPMLSKAQFDEFLAPYYRRIVPELKGRGIVPFVDTDGDVTPVIPWLEEVGIGGVLPLERMAGVDVAELRRRHPRLRMIGGFDKTVMHLGEARVRAEFERLLPVMRQGGYIPACDHQTPPEVSLADYRQYRRLLEEYSRKGVPR